MKGDKLWCPHCRKYFVDTEEMYDSRDGGRPTFAAPKKVHRVWECPYCLHSCGITNVNQTIIDEQEIIDRNKNNYKGSTIYKKFIKDWPKLLQQKDLNSRGLSI